MGLSLAAIVEISRALPAPPAKVIGAFAYRAAEKAKADAATLIASATPDRWSRFAGAGSPEAIRSQLGHDIDAINLAARGLTADGVQPLDDSRWEQLRRKIMGVYNDAYAAEADAPGWTSVLSNVGGSFADLAADVARELPSLPGKALDAASAAAKKTIHTIGGVAQTAIGEAGDIVGAAENQVLWLVLKVVGAAAVVAGVAVGIWYLAEKTDLGRGLAKGAARAASGGLG